MTRQRREVYDILVDERDHPTAAEVYEKASKRINGISLATVYNCLETLVKHGVVQQVNFERESSRYCPNCVDHGHFYDESTGKVYDIPLKEGIQLSDFLDIPKGALVQHLDITMKGTLKK